MGYGGDSLHSRLALLDPILKPPPVGWITYRLNTMCLTAVKSVTRWHIQSTATLVLLETEPTSSNSHASVPRYVSIPLAKSKSKILEHSENEIHNFTLPITVEIVTQRKPQCLRSTTVWAVLINALSRGNNCKSPEKTCNASRAQLGTMLSAFCS